MLRQSHLDQSNERRGVILMIVIILLTMFAILGLLFILYADAESTASAIYRDSQSFDAADQQPVVSLFSFAFGQLIYDADDLATPYSAMRGNSLSRDMYGWNNGQLAFGAASLTPGNSVPITLTNASGITVGMVVTVDPDVTPEQTQVTAVAGNIITVISLSSPHIAPFRVIGYVTNSQSTYAAASVPGGMNVPITVASAAGISPGVVIVDPDTTPEQAIATAVSGNIITVASLTSPHTAPFRVIGYSVQNNRFHLFGLGSIRSRPGAYRGAAQPDRSGHTALGRRLEPLVHLP
jgi:hypothetical protein